jgi:diguanylate cyclase (GGDEF)-like protein/PAS domain S-box-containing protein
VDYTNYTREQLIETITELKMLNKQLLLEKEQEAKLDFAWTGNLGHWYFNIKTGTVVFNPLKVEVLGYTMEDLPEKVSYRFFTDKLHPDDYENTMNAMRRNMDGTADVYECEYRLQAKDGSWKWLYDRGKVTQRDANGNPEFAAGIVFDITDQKEKEIQLQSENRILEERSTKDALTGIHNRRAIMEELEKRINQSLNYGSPLCIGLLDIDHFKAINDTKGHVVGDQILQKVAQIISTGIRGLDGVGRYGGEEFLIIFPNTRQEGARLVCERIRTNIEEFDFGDGLQLTVSGGVAEYRIGQSLTEFIDQADTKLYEAKTSGRNRIKIT